MKYLKEVEGRGGIYAKCVMASIANDVPLYTLETHAPKFIDAEIEKHRMLSTNSSSSRAIPFHRYSLEKTYLPFDLRVNQGGMQGNTIVSENDSQKFRDMASKLYDHICTLFIDENNWHEIVHKQHLNRFVEAWTFQKKVFTATEWDNFFILRLNKDYWYPRLFELEKIWSNKFPGHQVELGGYHAQPEIQELARCMCEAMKDVELTELKPGEWHTPYALDELTDLEEQIKSSAAGCARGSYGVFGGKKRTYEKDCNLVDGILLPHRHMTPFENQATPMKHPTTSHRTVIDPSQSQWDKGVTHMDFNGIYWSSNFKSWIQYRQLADHWHQSMD